MKINIRMIHRKLANQLLTPRLAYTHIFIQREEVNSTLHVQNPFSFFWPEGNVRAKAIVEIRNEKGRLLSKVSRHIQPYGTLALPIDEIAQGLIETPSHGTITVDLIPPKNYRRHLRNLTAGVPLIASPFWMRFSSTCNGSHGYSHSIEADRSKLRGLPPVLSRVLASKENGSDWESSRSIDLGGSTSAQAFLVNSSKQIREVKISWCNHDGQEIVQRTSKLHSYGVVEISTPLGLQDSVHLKVDCLPTPNAKPYVFVYGETGQFGFTHG